MDDPSARKQLALDDDFAFLLQSTEPPHYQAPPEVTERLNRVEILLAQKQKEEARRVLAGTFQYAVKNPRFWWLVARASHTKAQAARALRKVVSLRPRDETTLRLLYKLEGKPFPQPQPRHQPQSKTLWQSMIKDARLLLFALIAAAIVAIIVSVAIYYF